MVQLILPASTRKSFINICFNLFISKPRKCSVCYETWATWKCVNCNKDVCRLCSNHCNFGTENVEEDINVQSESDHETNAEEPESDHAESEDYEIEQYGLSIADQVINKKLHNIFEAGVLDSEGEKSFRYCIVIEVTISNKCFIILFREWYRFSYIFDLVSDTVLDSYFGVISNKGKTLH